MTSALTHMFHGVGPGTCGLFVETEAHAKLLDYLEANSNRILTSSMVNVAKHLKMQAMSVARIGNRFVKLERFLKVCA